MENNLFDEVINLLESFVSDDEFDDSYNEEFAEKLKKVLESFVDEDEFSLGESFNDSRKE